MKKTFTILFSVGLALSAAAQHGNQSGNDYHYKNDQPFAASNNHQQDNKDNSNNKQWGYNQQNAHQQDRDYSKDDNSYNGKKEQMQEKDRRAAIDRVNHDYDQRISGYRNDRSMNNYERNRRIAEAQRERQDRIGSVGKGIFAGAIVGLVAAALFSH